MNNSNKPKGNFKIIQIIYGSLIIGIVVFMLFAISSNTNTSFSYTDGTIFMYIVPILFFSGFMISPFLYNKTMINIKDSDSLFKKLTKYQSANIMRGAPLEASGLVAVVGFFMTSNDYYLIFAGLAIAVMLYHFPSKNKFETAIDLNMEEKMRLREI